jgi:phytoene dehydrogenase-like protein
MRTPAPDLIEYAIAMTASPDAVVIGSGPNGLCAAIALAQAGRQVLVLEGANTLGGGARTAELTLPGFRHDPCSAIHPMALSSPFMRSLPLDQHGLSWVHPPAPLAHPLDGQPAAILERDLQATAATLGPDGDRWASWMQTWVQRWDDISADALAPLGVPSHPFLMAGFGLAGMRAASSVAQRFEQPAARALFAGLAAHSVLPLDMAPSAAIGLMLGIAGHAVGWPFPEGGAQGLSDALAAHLRLLGGEIQTGSPVHSLAQLPDEIPLLFETAPARLADIAGDALPTAYADKLRAFRHGPGICKLDYALSGPLPWTDPAVARAGTVHLGGTLEEIALSERAAWDGEHCDRPFVLLAQQSLFDSTRAPSNQHTLWAYCHVPSGSTRDVSAQIEAQIERYAPGWRDLILAKHVQTAAQTETYNPNYIGGDVNGGAPTLDQLFTRPTARLSPYTTPHPRLFLCSASTPPGGGIHGMCGWHAAQAVLKRFRD